MPEASEAARIVRAVELFEAGAATTFLGCSNCQNCLGWCHENGIGIPKDHNKALQIYRLAAQAGLPAAEFNLGLMILRGGDALGDVEANLREAVRLFQNGYKKNHAWSALSLAHQYSGGSSVRARARVHARLCVRGRTQVCMCACRLTETRPEACRCTVMLATCYRDGLGVPRDSEMMVRHAPPLRSALVGIP